jgi:hypothetical protein
MWDKLTWQADPLAFAVALASILITSYIALLLHRLSRKFGQSETIRSINEGWDSFHNAILNKEVHDLFWEFVGSEKPFAGVGDRAHHIVLMYLNNIHNLKQARLTVNRSKNSLSTEQPLAGDELRAIKRYLATREDKLPWLFLSEREQPMTRQAVNYLIREAGERAKLGRVWPHMLRHSCGYALANKGADFRVIQDYLGHRDPRHTVRYTRTSARRFEGLWD